MPNRVLVSWIGNTDLSALAGTLEGDELKTVVAALPPSNPLKATQSPIKTLLDAEQFDEVHLLSNYATLTNDLFVRWLGGHTIAHAVKLSDPTNYVEVFGAADQVLGEVTRQHGAGKFELGIHLSPGTPTMAAIWVLLGKSRYPAVFYQTHAGKASRTEIPFDLALDYVPDLLRQPDASLQHLAARRPDEIPGFTAIIGDSKPIRLAVGLANKAAVRDVPVLILGESGVGKEAVARGIHDASHRRGKPFVVINCAAIPRDLLEAALFGNVKGAFTGAVDRAGAFESANGGTLFLDEVGECDPAMQAKLLRVLEPGAGKGPCHRVFQRVGETAERTSDVRVLAATNRDLVAMIGSREFREDLYYRLAVIKLKLPALRERRADIPLLVAGLLDRINRDFRGQEPGYQDKSLSPAAMAFVRRQDWPGNVRQLYNALLQAAVMSDGTIIESAELAAAVADAGVSLNTGLSDLPLDDGFSLERHLGEQRRRYLERALGEAGGNKKKAAALLGMKHYQTFDAQLKRYGVRAKRNK